MTSDPPRSRSPVAQAVVLLVLVVLGLGLYFWFVPRSPVAAVPAAEHDAS
jgi:hypothetical protein